MRENEPDVATCSGKVMRGIVRGARDAWRTETGAGVTLHKSEGRWLLDASPAALVPIEGYALCMVEPRHALGGLVTPIPPRTVDGGTWPAGDYRCVFGGGAYKHRTSYGGLWDFDTGSPTGEMALYADITKVYDFASSPDDTPVEAEDNGESISGAADLAGTNIITLAANPTILYVNHTESDYTDSEWVNQDSDTAAIPFFRGLAAPMFGIIAIDYCCITFPTTAKRNYGDPLWLAYPSDVSPPCYLTGVTGKTYRVRVDVEAFIPSKYSAGDADTFATYVKDPAGNNVIVPTYIGAPGSSQLLTATYTTDVAGDEVGALFVPFVVRYAPSYADHSGDYVRATLTTIKVF